MPELDTYEQDGMLDDADDFDVMSPEARLEAEREMKRRDRENRGDRRTAQLLYADSDLESEASAQPHIKRRRRRADRAADGEVVDEEVSHKFFTCLSCCFEQFEFLDGRDC